MLSIILLFVGIATADHEQNNFVAVEWATQADGTVFLVPAAVQQAASDAANLDRMPAGQDLPPQDPYYPPPRPPKYKKPKKPVPHKGRHKGLGKYSCIKTGFMNAGEGDVSNKFIAMLAVQSKTRASHFGYTNDQIDNVVLRETIFTAAALGPCKGSSYRFNSSEAARAEQWLDSPRPSVDRDDYKEVFQMDSRRVDVTVKSFNSTPFSIQRDWKYWNKKSPAYSCSTPYNGKKRINLCQHMVRACGAIEVGCERGYVENIENNNGGGGDGNSGGNDGGGNSGGTGGSDGGTSGGDTGGGNTGGDTGGGNTGGDTGGNTGGSDNGAGTDGGSSGNAESGSGSNEGAGHGGDAGGGHGGGPGGM